jgi:hypothetical protein
MQASSANIACHRGANIQKSPPHFASPVSHSPEPDTWAPHILFTSLGFLFLPHHSPLFLPHHSPLSPKPSTPPPTSPGCPNPAAHPAPPRPFHRHRSPSSTTPPPSPLLCSTSSRSRCRGLEPHRGLGLGPCCAVGRGLQMRGHLRPRARAADEGPAPAEVALPLSPREAARSAPRSWRELPPRPGERGDAAGGHGRSWRSRPSRPWRELSPRLARPCPRGVRGCHRGHGRKQQEMQGRRQAKNPGRGPSLASFSPCYREI